MGRCAVEIEIIVLDVLAVIGLAVGETENPFLQDRVLAVPQRKREAQALPVVADARQPVLAPVIGARAGLVVAEIVPSIAVLAVVLAHRAPLALAQIRPPLPPRHAVLARLVETCLLGGLLRPRGCTLGHRALPIQAVGLISISRSRHQVMTVSKQR